MDGGLGETAEVTQREEKSSEEEGGDLVGELETAESCEDLGLGCLSSTRTSAVRQSPGLHVDGAEGSSGWQAWRGGRRSSSELDEEHGDEGTQGTRAAPGVEFRSGWSSLAMAVCSSVAHRD